MQFVKKKNKNKATVEAAKSRNFAKLRNFLDELLDLLLQNFYPNCKINTEKVKKNYRKLKNKLEAKIK